MGNMKNSAFVSTLGALALLLVASVAWACTGQARILSVTPQAGPPASEATVMGEAIRPGTPVQVHWNSLEGSQLASATAGSDGKFSVSAEVPQVGAGVYYIVVTAGESAVARNAFEVTHAAGSPPDALAADSRPVGTRESSVLWDGFAASRADLEAGASKDASRAPAWELSTLGMTLAAASMVGILGLATAGGLRRRKMKGEVRG